MALGGTGVRTAGSDYRILERSLGPRTGQSTGGGWTAAGLSDGWRGCSEPDNQFLCITGVLLVAFVPTPDSRWSGGPIVATTKHYCTLSFKARTYCLFGGAVSSLRPLNFSFLISYDMI